MFDGTLSRITFGGRYGKPEKKKKSTGIFFATPWILIERDVYLMENPKKKHRVFSRILL